MAEILHFLLRHGYPVLFAWVFLEQAGLPMPSSPLLFVAGALAGAGEMGFASTIGLVMVAAMTADLGWFLWGRWRGAGVLALDACSALLWAGAFMGLGRIFSRQLDLLAYYVRGFGGAVLALLVVLLAVYITRKYLARRRLLRGIWTERIEASELRGLMEEGISLAIVDLRHEMDYRLHPFVIPGATHFDPGDLDGRQQEIPRDREIVLYCT
jgi:hypothetical protein